MNDTRKNNRMKKEKITELAKHCHKLYCYKSKPHLLSLGDTENINVITAVTAIIYLLNI